MARTRKQLTYAYALQSFLGYLEGTEKSAHTIKSYRCDLEKFRRFLERHYGTKKVDGLVLKELGTEDLNAFYEFLKGQKLKTNTRRRLLMTVRKFFQYLGGRNHVPSEMGQKVLAPHKIERVPTTVQSAKLIAEIKAVPTGTLLLLRNQVLLWTLAETGCLVSEVCLLQFAQWKKRGNQCSLEIRGKNPRKIPVTLDLYEKVGALHELSQSDLQTKLKDSPWLFLGFNKFGALGSHISPRGVELLVKSYGPKLGYDLTPRVLRHSIVIEWYRAGMDRSEIQRRLGLRTDYAFRVYEPIFKSIDKGESPAEQMDH